MSYTITLHSSGRQFLADANMTLLESALSAGIKAPYGCRNGACGACKCKVLAGDFDPGPMLRGTLQQEELEEGYTLLCCASPYSDMSLALREASYDEFPVKKMPVRVETLQQLAPDVMLIRLKLPATERLQYAAGQFVEFLLKDGSRRAYSIANAPGGDDNCIELHVRRMSNGQFSEHVFTTMKPRDILRIEGPHGSFHLRESSNKPIIFLAGGTGFAPIKAVIEYAIHIGVTRPMFLYWGSPNRAGLYRDELAQEWQRQYAHIRYVPVLSEAAAEDAWRGRSGLVHHAVLEDFADLSAYQVYACGAPVMIEAARRDFAARALPMDEFFADAFTFAAKPTASGQVLTGTR